MIEHKNLQLFVYVLSFIIQMLLLYKPLNVNVFYTDYCTFTVTENNTNTKNIVHSLNF